MFIKVFFPTQFPGNLAIKVFLCSILLGEKLIQCLSNRFQIGCQQVDFETNLTLANIEFSNIEKVIYDFTLNKLLQRHGLERPALLI